tara:strand:- start:1123 stop:1536 length:414 start_codon:yes stop_codon:yes gene_type:complete
MRKCPKGLQMREGICQEPIKKRINKIIGPRKNVYKHYTATAENNRIARKTNRRRTFALGGSVPTYWRYMLDSVLEQLQNIQDGTVEGEAVWNTYYNIIDQIEAYQGSQDGVLSETPHLSDYKRGGRVRRYTGRKKKL